MRPGDVTKTSKWLQKRDGPNSKKPLNLFGTEATQQSLLNQYTDTNTEMDNTIILCKAVLLIFFQTSVISLLWLASVTTGQFTDCLQANRTCHQDQKCHLLLTVLPRQCGDGKDRQGESCSPLQIQYCSQSLRDILQFNHFQTCQCPHNMPNYEECEAFRESVFLHKCAEISQTAQNQYVVQARPADSTYTALYTGLDDNRSSSGDSDCLEMRKTCQSQRLCSRDLTAFRQHCRVRGGRCYADSRERCIEAYEALRQSGMFHCSCGGEKKQHSRRKCHGILNRFAKNACLVVANQAALLGREDQKLPAKPKTDPVETAKPSISSGSSTISGISSGISGGISGGVSGGTSSGVSSGISSSNNDISNNIIKDNSATESNDVMGEADYEYEILIDGLETDDKIVPPTTLPTSDVSCYRAFAGCNADSTCRVKVGKFLAACQWDLSKKSCDRQACLPAMNSFFQTVDMKHAHAAAFCTCEPDDRQCHSLKSVLQPKCAQMETPTPSCMSIYRKCMTDDTCRKRTEYYDTYCKEDSRTNGCVNTQSMCRDAVVGLMGTILMTNCTCDYEVAINRCKTIEYNLHNNRCRLQASSRNTTTRHVPTHVNTPMKDENELVKYRVNTVQNEKPRKLCNRRRLEGRHKVTRVYTDQSECSEICRCLLNGTMSCRSLSCLSKKSCSNDDVAYSHGMLFILPHRGQCQCRSGETICTKPFIHPTGEGVYIFVGYSIEDMLALTNHSIKISYTALSQKLTHLLNGDRFIDTCTVSRYDNTPGNIVFRIDTLRTTRHSRSGSRTYAGSFWNIYQTDDHQYDQEEGCFFKAKLLEIMINGHQEAIASDPELSIFHLATVETIEKEMASRRSDAHQNYTWSSTAAILFGSICFFLRCMIS